MLSRTSLEYVKTYIQSAGGVCWGTKAALSRQSARLVLKQVTVVWVKKKKNAGNTARGAATQTHKQMENMQQAAAGRLSSAVRILSEQSTETSPIG